MTRIIATIAIVLSLLLAGCAPEPPSSHFTPSMEQQQTIVIDQGW